MELSDESHGGWRTLAQTLGMPQRVMFEVLGRHIDVDALHPDIVKLVEEEGRALAAERARKGGPKPKKKQRPKK